MVSRAKSIVIIIHNVCIRYIAWCANEIIVYSQKTNVYFLTKDFVSTSTKVLPKRKIREILLSPSVQITG